MANTRCNVILFKEVSERMKRLKIYQEVVQVGGVGCRGGPEITDRATGG